MYYYYELGYYYCYYLAPCNKHLLKLFYEMKGKKKSASYIDIGKRKSHIGRPLISYCRKEKKQTCVSCGFSVPVCISVRCWPLVWARPLTWTSCSADPILSEHAQLEECWPNYSTELYDKEKTLINWLKTQFNDSLLKSIPCVEFGMFLPFISEWLI